MTLGCHAIGYGPEKLIVLHGWLSDHTVYAPLMPLFDQARYSVVFADYRGYGRSRAMTGDYSIDEIASDVIDLAKTLGWDRCHLVGHSMAGMVIQKVALLAPGLVTSGTAITPVPASGLPLDAETAAFFRSAIDDDAALAEIFNILTGKRHAKTFLDLMVDGVRVATQKEALLGYFKAWTGTDFAGDVAKLSTPILAIAGTHDGAVGPDVMRETYLKQLPNVQLEIIEEAGHYPTQETPVALFNLIEKFIASVASGQDSRQVA